MNRLTRDLRATKTNKFIKRNKYNCSRSENIRQIRKAAKKFNFSFSEGDIKYVKTWRKEEETHCKIVFFDRRRRPVFLKKDKKEKPTPNCLFKRESRNIHNEIFGMFKSLSSI